MRVADPVKRLMTALLKSPFTEGMTQVFQRAPFPLEIHFVKRGLIKIKDLINDGRSWNKSAELGMDKPRDPGLGKTLPQGTRKRKRVDHVPEGAHFNDEDVLIVHVHSPRCARFFAKIHPDSLPGKDSPAGLLQGQRQYRFGGLR